eukprot:543839-Rhodomonas_salina.1
MFAARGGGVTHVALVKTLVSFGASVNTANRNGWSPLHFAAQTGAVGVVKELGQGNVDLEARTQEGITPLMLAAKHGHELLVRYLIEAGVNLEMTAKSEATALILAAENGMAETVRELISAGAELEAVDFRGATALLLAASSGRVEVVKLLIAAGANVDAESINVKGRLFSTYTAALAGNHLQIVNLLEEAGVDVELSLARGAAAEKEMKQKLEVPDFISDRTVARELLKKYPELKLKGASRKVRRELEQNAAAMLHVMAALGRDRWVRSLLSEGGVDVDDVAGSQQNETALHIAAAHGQTEVAIFLIKAGANADAVSKTGATPLGIATQRGDILLVKHLLHLTINGGANPNQVCAKDGMTPLGIAAELGSIEIGAALVRVGAKAKMRVANGTTTLLCIAVQGRQLGFVEMLLQQDALDLGGEAGASALLAALQTEQPQILSALIRNGAPVDAVVAKSNQRPVHVAATRGLACAVAELAAAGADIEARTREGETALQLAASRGLADVVRVLIDVGARLEGAAPESKATALHLAAVNHLVEVGQMLIAAGANPEATTRNGTTPLGIATQQGDVEMIWTLVAGGVELDRPCIKSGMTPLCVAAQIGDVGAAQALLTAGADGSAPGAGEWTPLHVACHAGRHAHVLELLLSQSADTSALRAGATPLWHAALIGDERVVRALLRHGADVNFTRAGSKETPLSVAAAK